ncbi:hypothetical protein P4646_12770 [Peribacillus simplex]|uniref:Stage III sporulation protein AF n=1 Tax=Peribacillus simplex TaxID=1478 RepID=A0A8B5Y4Q8_9BACI|nr:hypothetical protein [Peribacillus simplex]MED3909801.1 hypothetical protein [Peribacillus simplex]MED3984910.1 hypothetical protein [Peribacillus simplex]MED4097455.1 hypothetical protein [Peribacillus simplex]TVX84110.1 hypothetical protein FQP34_02505 [Peribacillus simplex]
MVAVAGILVIVAVIIAIDVPPLMRKKLKKELWIFYILLLFGTALSIAQALNIKIPNPLDWITAIYKPLSDMIEKLLK